MVHSNRPPPGPRTARPLPERPARRATPPAVTGDPHILPFPPGDPDGDGPDDDADLSFDSFG